MNEIDQAVLPERRRPREGRQGGWLAVRTIGSLLILGKSHDNF